MHCASSFPRQAGGDGGLTPIACIASVTNAVAACPVSGVPSGCRTLIASQKRARCGRLIDSSSTSVSTSGYGRAPAVHAAQGQVRGAHTNLVTNGLLLRADIHTARHPGAKTSKGTIQLRPADADGIGDDELLELVRAAWTPDPRVRQVRRA